MIALLAGAAAVGCVILAALLLHRVGPGYRVARSLAAAPTVSLAEAAALAARGERRYVKAIGRVSSVEEFPDENERPLVFRRRRIEQADSGKGWRLVDEERVAVPFGIEDRTDLVGVDLDALGDGLVVMPRESLGRAADLPAAILARIGRPLAPDLAVRMRLDQVSAVEHATVAGVVVAGPSGATFTAGMGRPLVLSTLEADVAMRLLAGDRRSAVVTAAAALVAGMGLAAAAVVALVAGW